MIYAGPIFYARLDDELVDRLCEIHLAAPVRSVRSTCTR
jgi:hypothetical protein